MNEKLLSGFRPHVPGKVSDLVDMYFHPQESASRIAYDHNAAASRQRQELEEIISRTRPRIVYSDQPFKQVRKDFLKSIGEAASKDQELSNLVSQVRSYDIHDDGTVVRKVPSANGHNYKEYDIDPFMH